MDSINLSTFQALAAKFRTEEDVRAESNRFFRNTCDLFGINIMDSGHEVTSIYGGRADSIYSDVILEYKSPDVDVLSKSGLEEVVDGRNNKDRGLRHYLVNFALEQSYNNEDLFLQTLFSKVGVGFNGSAFVFLRYIPSDKEYNLLCKRKTKSFPIGIKSKQFVDLKVETISDLSLGMKKLFLYLRSTGRKQLSSASILELFGPASQICIDAISSIYTCLCQNLDSNILRVITLFEEWNRIFGDVYGDKEPFKNNMTI